MQTPTSIDETRFLALGFSEPQGRGAYVTACPSRLGHKRVSVLVLDPFGNVRSLGASVPEAFVGVPWAALVAVARECFAGVQRVEFERRLAALEEPLW